MNRKYELGCHGTHATKRNDRMRPLWALGNEVREQIVRAERRFRGAIRRVHGPEHVHCARDELVVLSLGRDAEAWITSFIEHHLSLGAKHIYFLDNASSDATVELASRHDHVTVYTTPLSYRHFEVGLQRWLVKSFGRNRWSLYCDADELWDYPFSDRLPLRQFLGYLNQGGYTAVTGQMLDMFSDKPFSALESHPDDDLKEKYPFYDLSALRTTRDIYWIRDGDVESTDVACIFGGIRKHFFGDDCLLLTKHPLVYADDSVGIYTYDSHFMTGARVADVTTVQLHYKYIATLGQRVRQSVHWHKESADLLGGVQEVLEERPDLCLRLDTAERLNGVQQLVESGFLKVSDPYRRWVEEHGG